MSAVACIDPCRRPHAPHPWPRAQKSRAPGQSVTLRSLRSCVLIFLGTPAKFARQQASVFLIFVIQIKPRESVGWRSLH